MQLYRPNKYLDIVGCKLYTTINAAIITYSFITLNPFRPMTAPNKNIAVNITIIINGTIDMSTVLMK